MAWPAILGALGMGASAFGANQQQKDFKAAEGKSERANVFAQLQSLGLLDQFKPILEQALDQGRGLHSQAVGELDKQRSRTRDAYQFALGTVASQGAAAQQGIADSGRQAQGAGDAVMRSRGLYSSSAATNLQRGVRADTDRASTNLAGQMAGLGAGIRTGQADAEARDTASYAQGLQGLASFLQGGAQQKLGLEQDKINVLLQTMSGFDLDDQGLANALSERFGPEFFHGGPSGNEGGSNDKKKLLGMLGGGLLGGGLGGAIGSLF